MQKPVLEMNTFCDEYETGRTKAYEEIASGRLKAIKLGSKTLIRREDAEAWLKSLPAAVVRPANKAA